MTTLSDALAVIRVLRAGPASGPELAAATGMNLRKVYRMLAELKASGAPLRESEAEFERKGRGGSAATRYSISAAGLVEWLTPSTK
jgi:predicted DNA-binding transcriptional regulator YafY